MCRELRPSPAPDADLAGLCGADRARGRRRPARERRESVLATFGLIPRDRIPEGVRPCDTMNAGKGRAGTGAATQSLGGGDQPSHLHGSSHGEWDAAQSARILVCFYKETRRVQIIFTMPLLAAAMPGERGPKSADSEEAS